MLARAAFLDGMSCSRCCSFRNLLRQSAGAILTVIRAGFHAEQEQHGNDQIGEGEWFSHDILSASADPNIQSASLKPKIQFLKFVDSFGTVVANTQIEQR